MVQDVRLNPVARKPNRKVMFVDLAVKFPTKRLNPVAGRELEKMQERVNKLFPTKRLNPVAGSIVYYKGNEVARSVSNKAT